MAAPQYYPHPNSKYRETISRGLACRSQRHNFMRTVRSLFSVIWILQGWMNRCIHILSATAMNQRRTCIPLQMRRTVYMTKYDE